MAQATATPQIPTLKLFSSSEEWPIKELVHHEYIQQRCAQTKGNIRTHRHLDLFHLLYIFNGSARAVLDGEEIRVHAPLLVTVPTMCVHGFTPTEMVHGHLLTIPGSSLRHVLSYQHSYSEFAERPRLLQGRGGEKWPELDQLFRELAREYTHDNPARFLAIQSLLRLIFVWILRNRTHQPGQPVENQVADRDAQRIRKFKALIEEHFRSGFSIKEYANLMGISSAQLNNICRAKVGRSALQIVHQRLTLEAKRALVYTSLTISEIAYDLGFTDPAYFTRFFSKQVGSSPKLFRVEHRPDTGFTEGSMVLGRSRKKSV